MDFKTWYDEADMPTKLEDGTWVDLETGIRFSASSKQPRQQIASSAAEARQSAKALGLSALTGTMKQKEWAEKIRAGFLKTLVAGSPEMNFVLLFGSKKSADWIENRADLAGWIGGQHQAFKDAAQAETDAQKKALEAFETMYAESASKFQSFSGSPAGVKLADGEINGQRVRVFENRANGEITLLRGEGKAVEIARVAK